MGNPLLLERAALARRRWTLFWASPLEAAFSILVVAVALAIAQMISVPLAASQGAGLLAFARDHRLALPAAAFALDTVLAMPFAEERCRRWRGSWLSALLRPGQRRTVLALDLALRALLMLAAATLVLGLCHWLNPSSSGWSPLRIVASLAAAFAASGLLAYQLTQSQLHRDATLAIPAGQPPIDLRGPGLQHWQHVTLGTTWRKRRTVVLLSPWLLLMPGGEGPRTTLALLLLALAVSVTLASWNRAMNVVVRASLWLRAQPLSPRRLLTPLMASPLVMAALGAMVIAASLTVLGMVPWIAGGFGLCVLLTALLHAACVAAWRQRPARIGAMFSACVILLLGALQSFPPLALVAWLAMMVWLARQGLRA